MTGREHVNQQFNKLTPESVGEQDPETAVGVGKLEAQHGLLWWPLGLGVSGTC